MKYLLSGLLAFGAICLGLNAATYTPVPLVEAAGEEAYLQAEWMKSVLAFNQKTLVSAYRDSGSRHASWDKEAESLLGSWAQRFSGAQSTLNNAEIFSLARRLDNDLKCTDPLVYYCIGKTYGLYNQKKDMSTAYDRAYALSQEKECPSLRRAFMCVRMYEKFDAIKKRSPEQQTQLEKYVREYVEDIKNSAMAGEYAGIERLLVEHVTTNSVKDHAASKIMYEGLIAMSGKLDEKWVAGSICGWASVKLAWWHRGTGWANTVTDEGWAGFHKYLKQAEEKFTESWKLNPDSPVAAAEMITVAMGTKTVSSERAWFDRAVAAQFDYTDAYDKYEWSLRPRWGGSHAEMLAFGLECAETKRSDTVVTLRLNTAIYNIFGESIRFKQPEAAAEMFKKKAVWLAVSEAINERVAVIDPERLNKWYKTTYAVLAYKFGELQVASDAAEEMQGKYFPAIIRHYKMDNVNMVIEEPDDLDDL